MRQGTEASTLGQLETGNMFGFLIVMVSGTHGGGPGMAPKLSTRAARPKIAPQVLRQKQGSAGLRCLRPRRGQM